MTPIGLDEAIAAHPIAGELSPEHVQALAKHARRVRYKTGEFLLREGEEASATFLVVKGRVALEIHSPSRGPIRIATASDGETVGWSWLGAIARWHFDARAVETTEAIVLDGKALRAACDADHELGYALLRRFLPVVTSRLEAMRVQLVDLYSARRGQVGLPWA